VSPNVKRYATSRSWSSSWRSVLRAAREHEAPENLNSLDRFILRVSAPIEFGASSVARGISNLWGD